MTLENLSERSGLSPHFLSTVEGDKRDPSLSTIKAIAKGLGCQPGELLGVTKGVSPAAMDVARLFDLAPSEVQDGIAMILRTVRRRGRP